MFFLQRDQIGDNMYEELQFINQWLSSKDGSFLLKHGIDKSFFFALHEVIVWVEDFYVRSGKLPSIETVSVQFEDFKEVSEHEPLEYIKEKLIEKKVYVEYKPILQKNAEIIASGKTIDALFHIRTESEGLIKKHTGRAKSYDWVKNANERYEAYLKTHGQEGLTGLTTGLNGLDHITGGWKSDDLVLLTARLNEGKSLLGTYFTFNVWKSLMTAKIASPVVYITTEMPELEISYRLDTMKAHFSNTQLSEGKLSDPDDYKEYLQDLHQKETGFLILSQDSNGGKAFTPTDIRAVIETHKPAFICIDQLYDISDGTGERDIRKRIVNVSNAIREINLSTKTPILLIAQAGRESAKSMKKDSNATPELHEVQESDNPAQKATRVLSLRMIEESMFKLTLKKNRSGKKNIDIFLDVDIDKGWWREVTKEESVF
jgi:replicative DNA helicase